MVHKLQIICDKTIEKELKNINIYNCNTFIIVCVSLLIFEKLLKYVIFLILQLKFVCTIEKIILITVKNNSSMQNCL